MTMPVALEPSARVPRLRRAGALVAVGAARLLMRLPPRRLRAVLCALRRGARPATAGEALAARQAVVTVSVQCAGQGCLQRSLATALLCRAGGAWPDWCTGVRMEPFRAHAWVEVGGDPVGERDDIRAFATTMAVRARDVRRRSDG
ncbi:MULTISPECIES: lasso peptide biosynthesis B2 protein [Actinomadura]|uniref:Lasso peptide biosynthesis B2 protein n=1 Tax=Actinomadura yumaensis TaxID=111807 RepID=A0ABW2D1C5_9ACTN|nr:lasso peptide biosynthesis B2 protein [Actinomadura sp. J1-007]MWK38902.1 lasso peptide biosynthesis B2 protein [Actinomadura sp. J1-007]